MKLQHVEVLVKTMYMRLSEKISSQWQGNRRGYHKPLELREPLLLPPKGGGGGGVTKVRRVPLLDQNLFSIMRIRTNDGNV